MRCKEKPFSKSRDETEDVVHLIQQSNNEFGCTRAALVAKLMKLKNINEEIANANIECALCLRAIVSIHNKECEPILKDVASLKRERFICLKPSTNLDDIVFKSIRELGSKKCSSTEIHDHIRLTYDIKLKNADNLLNLIERALDNLCRKRIAVRLEGANEKASFFVTLNNDYDAHSTNGHYNGVLENCFPSTSSSSVHHNYNEESRPKGKGFSRKPRNGSGKDSNTTSSSGKGELRQLQDSLSQFFTPTSVRRSRLASINNTGDSNFRGSVEAVEKAEESKPLNKTLEILIDETPHAVSAPAAGSSDSSLRSGSLSSTTPSPHRRTDQLQDSLSPYFSTNTERRRRHEKGEYLILSNGNAPRRKFEMMPDTKICTIKEDDETLEVEKPRGISPVAQMKMTKSPPSSSPKRASLRVAIRGVRKRRELPSRLFAKRKANKLLKYAKGAFRQNSNGDSSAGSTSPKKNFKNGKLLTESASMVNRTMSSPMKSPKLSPFKAFNPTESFHTESGWQIPEEDCKIFDKAREIAQKELLSDSLQIITSEEDCVYPVKIKIANYEINSWYSSPYPQEYVTLPMLYICERCLTYLVDEAPHLKKCSSKFPPGNEIYRCNNISVFEVDGNLARVYCRNLCLLAKLFIDHKTLYFDVEPFLFYVLTMNDEKGCHFVGYFSKEKFSSQKYNLACIVTLPCYQGKGYGRFLIDFSYLLTRREHMLGTPERPLSELGRVAYQSYWKSALLEELYRSCILSSVKSLSINDISQRTGITLHDVLDTLMILGIIKVYNGMVNIAVNIQQLKKHWNRVKSSKTRIWLEERCLKWAPKIYSPTKEFPLRSPSISLIASPIKNEVSDIAYEKEKKPIVRRGRKRIIPQLEQQTANLAEKKKTRRRSSTVVNKRRKQIDEEFLSDDDDNDFHLKKMKSCKDDLTSSNHRKTPSSDEDDQPENEKPNRSRLSKKDETFTTPNKEGKIVKSRRFSNTTNYRRSKAANSSSSDDENFLVERNKKNQNIVALSENRIDSSTECENKSDDDGDDSSSAYGEPKRKISHNGRGRRPFVCNNQTSTSKRTFRGRRGRRKRITNQLKSDNPSDISNITDEKEQIKKLSENLDTLTPQINSENFQKCFQESSSTTDSDSDEENFRQRKYANTNENVHDQLKKRGRPPIYRPSVLNNEFHNDEEEGNEDDVCTASSVSSMSPHPLDDRQPLKCGINREPDTINMGGEPDIINMGGEPDEDIMSVPTMNVLSPKAPLAPPANVIEDDEQMEDDDLQTEGFFSNQTNKSVIESSSHASFEQASSHRSFDNVTDEFYTQPYQHQPVQKNLTTNATTSTVIQQSESFSIEQQYNNFVFNVPSTSSYGEKSSPAFDVAKSSCFGNIPPAHISNTNLTYYQQQQQQISGNLFNSNGKIESQTYATNSSIQLQQLNKNETVQNENVPIAMEDRHASDMPVLDAPHAASPSHPQFDPMPSKKADEEEDEDDAPPQLSPNVPSNDVQPITPVDGELTGNLRSMESTPSNVNVNTDSSGNESNNTKLSISNASPSISNASMANVSYDSSISQKSNAIIGSMESTAMNTQDKCQYTGNFVSSSISQLDYYNYTQHAITRFPDDFPPVNEINNLSPHKNENTNKISSSVDMAMKMRQDTAEYERQKSFAQSQSTAGDLSKLKPAGLTVNSSSSNIAGADGVISPPENNSAPPKLLSQRQTSIDLSLHLPNPIPLEISKNEAFSPMSTGYLPPTLAVPNQQPKASSTSGSKKSKKNKEKPPTTKLARRNKSVDNSKNHEDTLHNAPPKIDAPNFSQFMSMPFMSDYMSMAQFAMTNGASTTSQMNSLAMNSLMMNQTTNGPYYGANAANYFNMAMSATNAAYANQYQQMNSSFYNTGWSYYGTYPNNSYPSGMNANQPSAFRSDVSTPDACGNALVNHSAVRPTNTPIPSVLMNAVSVSSGSSAQPSPMAITEQQQRSLSSGAATALLSPNNWTPMMASAFSALSFNNLPHASTSGVLPCPHSVQQSAAATAADPYVDVQQSYNMNQYSSYSAHT